jgi:hypothetical protein
MLPPIKKFTSGASAFRVKVWGWMGHLEFTTVIFSKHSLIGIFKPSGYVASSGLEK